MAPFLLAVLLSWFPAGGILAGDSAGSDASSFTAVMVLPDDGKIPFIAEIDAAEASIHLYVYLLSDADIIDSLSRAHYRGVHVQVMLEPNPFGGAGIELDAFQRLDAAGVDVRWSSSAFRFAHVKMMIVDRQLLLVMNLNMTRAAFTQNREFAVITDDDAQIQEGLAIFESDWNGDPAHLAGALVVSPDTSRSDLLGFVGSARHSIDVYAEVISDSEFLDALAAAESRGVRVRLVMSEVEGESLRYEEPGYLVRKGVRVGILNRLYIHAKAIIVDDAVVWIGSQNFTANSFDHNREIGVFVDDASAVARVAAVFESDFAESEPLTVDPTAP